MKTLKTYTVCFDLTAEDIRGTTAVVRATTQEEAAIKFNAYWQSHSYPKITPVQAKMFHEFKEKERVHII